MATRQQAISSYFSSKAESSSRNLPTDLTNEDDELLQPPIKRRRTDEPRAMDKKQAKVATKLKNSTSDASPSTTGTGNAPAHSAARAQRVRQTLHVSSSPPTSRATSPHSQDDSEEETNSSFRKVAQSFENKAIRKGKKKCKSTDDVGPSGQAWTPLELQVRLTCFGSFYCLQL